MLGPKLLDELSGIHAQFLDGALVQLIEPHLLLRAHHLVTVRFVREPAVLARQLLDVGAHLGESRRALRTPGLDVGPRVVRHGHRLVDHRKRRRDSCHHFARGLGLLLPALSGLLGARPRVALGRNGPLEAFGTSGERTRSFLRRAQGEPRLGLLGAGDLRGLRVLVALDLSRLGVRLSLLRLRLRGPQTLDEPRKLGLIGLDSSARRGHLALEALGVGSGRTRGGRQVAQLLGNRRHPRVGLVEACKRRLVRRRRELLLLGSAAERELLLLRLVRRRVTLVASIVERRLEVHDAWRVSRSARCVARAEQVSPAGHRHHVVMCRDERPRGRQVLDHDDP